MKQIKTILLSMVLSLGVPQAQAATTNVVQNVSIQLWGVKSGGSETSRSVITSGIARVRIENRQIIQALGAATGNTFGNRARLVVVTPVGGGDSALQVRDGSAKVDVTAFFEHQQIGEAISGSQSNTVSHRSVDFGYSIQRLALRDIEGTTPLGLRFDVRGFASETKPSNRPVANFQMDAAGTGEVAGAPAILQGNVEVQGDRLEVVADDLPSA